MLELTYGNWIQNPSRQSTSFLSKKSLLVPSGLPRFPMLSQGPPEPRHWWQLVGWARWIKPPLTTAMTAECSMFLNKIVQLGSLASSSSTPDFTESQILQKLPGPIYGPFKKLSKAWHFFGVNTESTRSRLSTFQSSPWARWRKQRAPLKKRTDITVLKAPWDTEFPEHSWSIHHFHHDGLLFTILQVIFSVTWQVHQAPEKLSHIPMPTCIAYPHTPTKYIYIYIYTQSLRRSLLLNMYIFALCILYILYDIICSIHSTILSLCPQSGSLEVLGGLPKQPAEQTSKRLPLCSTRRLIKILINHLTLLILILICLPPHPWQIAHISP